ncbi:MAG: acyl carrier protein [Marinobacter sp.]|uniref:acyl carrier protein n=1 Tax=Marinobacter sp. TaxID=50741 RepID=UPI00299E85D1|nr:acyl carrier protein [Marinobacter sp.]MDX1755459.1 acyl carrier protein [Marinobacter sp.]
MSDSQQQVIEMIAEHLAVTPDSLCPTSRLVDDLGADSLDLVELTMTLEERFGLEVTDEQAERLATVADVIRFVAEQPA